MNQEALDLMDSVFQAMVLDAQEQMRSETHSGGQDG